MLFSQIISVMNSLAVSGSGIKIYLLLFVILWPKDISVPVKLTVTVDKAALSTITVNLIYRGRYIVNNVPTNYRYNYTVIPYLISNSILDLTSHSSHSNFKVRHTCYYLEVLLKMPRCLLRHWRNNNKNMRQFWLRMKLKTLFMSDEGKHGHHFGLPLFFC